MQDPAPDFTGFNSGPTVSQLARRSACWDHVDIAAFSIEHVPGRVRQMQEDLFPGILRCLLL